MSANWFLGFPLAAAPWIEALTPPPRGARVFHPDDVHATFVFLGPVGEDRARAAWNLTEGLVLAPTRFLPGPLHGFGDPRRPSAWSVEPSDGAPALRAFIAAHRDAVTEAGGGRPDRRPPRPHATLARPKRDAHPGVHRALATWAAEQRLPDLALPVDRLALFTWSEERGARLFRIVAERSLMPPTQ